MTDAGDKARVDSLPPGATELDISPSRYWQKYSAGVAERLAQAGASDLAIDAAGGRGTARTLRPRSRRHDRVREPHSRPKLNRTLPRPRTFARHLLSPYAVPLLLALTALLPLLGWRLRGQDDWAGQISGFAAAAFLYARAAWLSMEELRALGGSTGSPSLGAEAAQGDGSGDPVRRDATAATDVRHSSESQGVSTSSSALHTRPRAALVRSGPELVELSERFYYGVFVGGLLFVGVATVGALALLPLRAADHSGAPMPVAAADLLTLLVLTGLALTWPSRVFRTVRRHPQLELVPVLLATTLLSPLGNGLWWPACAILMVLATLVPLGRALAYCFLVLTATLGTQTVAGELHADSDSLVLWIALPLWTALAATIADRMTALILLTDSRFARSPSSHRPSPSAAARAIRALGRAERSEPRALGRSTMLNWTPAASGGDDGRRTYACAGGRAPLDYEGSGSSPRTGCDAPLGGSQHRRARGHGARRGHSASSEPHRTSSAARARRSTHAS